MTANDTATRRVTTGIVLAVGLFAGSEGCLPAFLPVLMTSFPVISGAGMLLFLRAGRGQDRPDEPFVGGSQTERAAG
jgi:hypothetical protein